MTSPETLTSFRVLDFLEWADQIVFVEIGVVKIMNRPTATWSRRPAKLKDALFIARLRAGAMWRRCRETIVPVLLQRLSER